jgi:hypothetical protein
VTLSRDRSRDLFIISHCEAFKHGAHLFIINITSILIVLYVNKVLKDAVVHSEHGKVIKCYFKPGSVERSIDLPKEGIPYKAAGN